MLILSLPPLNQTKRVEYFFSCPSIDGLRYNTGTRTPFDIDYTVKFLHELGLKYKKPIWIDLKCRQLRVAQWAVPTYGDIILNHPIKIEGQASILFRGMNKACQITDVNGSKIFVEPQPEQAIGAGQSVNIIGSHEVLGFFTDEDLQYIEACKKYNHNDILLSFVESLTDVKMLLDLIPTANPILKIENEKGMNFVRNQFSSLNGIARIMVARDDLSTNIINPFDAIPFYKKVIELDSESIVASLLFTSLERSSKLSLTDVNDFIFLKDIGFKHFMISDGISHYHYDSVLYFWKKYQYKESQ